MGTQDKGRKDRVVKHRVAHEYGVTRTQFHDLIKKASQPVNREAESDSSKSRTSEFHLSDDCSGTGRNPDNLEGKQD
jgi:hypothetical protein